MTDTRYRLRAFVCDGGVVHDVNDEGYSTLTNIFMRRDGGCRYAVVEDTTGVLVVDLFDLRWAGPDRFAMAVGAHQRHATLDAAIMATLLLYKLVSDPDKIHNFLQSLKD